jgi:hypothetical protein
MPGKNLEPISIESLEPRQYLSGNAYLSNGYTGKHE